MIFTEISRDFKKSLEADTQSTTLKTFEKIAIGSRHCVTVGRLSPTRKTQQRNMMAIQA